VTGVWQDKAAKSADPNASDARTDADLRMAWVPSSIKRMSAYLEVASVKGSFRFGLPGRRRYSMQYGYDARPSLWQKVTANAHLIIAGVGTASLMGIAGIALWLAMPASERQAFAETGKAIDHAQPVVVADAKPVTAAVAPNVLPAQQAAPVGAEASSSSGGSMANGLRLNGAAAQLAASPRSAPQAREQAFVSPKIDPVAAAAIAVTEEATGQKVDHAKVEDKQDSAKTAAISPSKPVKPDTAQAEEGKTAHILRAVTMRAGPKKRAAALTTIPAKTPIKVIACKSWCEVVYKGKRGWVYKSFVKRGG
jgi:hypothetical protein